MAQTAQKKTAENQPSTLYDQVPAEQMHPAQDLMNYVRNYARKKPDSAALWCFGIGFIVGWKLKPW